MNKTDFLHLRWLFFDLDDTLWDFYNNSCSALLILYESVPVLKECYQDYDKFAEVYHMYNDRLWRQYHQGAIDAAFLKRERFAAVLRGGGMNDAEADRYGIMLSSEYLEALAGQRLIVAHASEVLDILSRYFMIGVLSNGFKEVQYRKLYNTPLHRYVARMVLSDEIGVQKPNPRIFGYAASAVGARPEECMMIGDNPETDIAGALGAGWNVIYFRRPFAHYREGEGLQNVTVIDSLAELPELLLP